MPPFTDYSHLAYEKESCGVDVLNMLSTELRWLEEVLVPPPPCHAFQTLLAGHLHLCRTLFTCEGIDKLDLGKGGCGLIERGVAYRREDQGYCSSPRTL